MPNELKIENQIIPYVIKPSLRARRLRISVGRDSGVVVILPKGINILAAKQFVEQKQGWILRSLKYFDKFQGRLFVKSSRGEYLRNKQQALNLARAKVTQWNIRYNFLPRKISIKNQKTRWGSCSKKGNLNFNYKIVHLSESLVDYLVVHELCHLKEFNHSKRFWELVGQAIPDYKKLRGELRKFGISLT
jgi:predicted metal-dependent hydrolase